MQEQEKVFLDAKEISALLGVKRSRAYAIIKTLNEQLEKAGKLTIRGKANKAYLLKMISIDDI